MTHPPSCEGSYSNADFLVSAISDNSVMQGIESVIRWVEDFKARVHVSVERISIRQLDNWTLDQDQGRIRHVTGGFFSVDGIRVKTNRLRTPEWDQPIINQPEIGYLGFIVKKFNGVLHFLTQAKIEPGNINHVQLSPTIQATRSNYTGVHKGNTPLYLDYFRKVSPDRVLLDQLHSEQGARFLMKRNRNIIISVDDIDLHDGFIWLTLRQLKALMQYDNLVNMDVRTVLSGIQYGDITTHPAEVRAYFDHRTNRKSDIFRSYMGVGSTLVDLNGVLHFVTKAKSENDLIVEKIHLNDMRGWVAGEDEIYRPDGKYFRIIGVDVKIGNREVQNWQQPMVEPAQIGMCGCIAKMFNGTLHVIVQAKLECGNRDVIELAPTVQCLTGNYLDSESMKVPFLEYLLNARADQAVFDSMQSEEGGRFFREQNRNIMVIADQEFDDRLPENFIWMSLHQLSYLNRFNNFLNIQLRNLLAMVPFI